MEEVKVIFENDKIRMEEITSLGAVSPCGFWYDQAEGEMVSVTIGEAEIEFFDGEKVFLKQGEWFYIDKHVKHRVTYTSNDCKWLCAFTKEEEKKEN